MGRLVEAGVTFVEVVSNGWDTHQENFTNVKRLAGGVDPGFAGLVSDLKTRGLLDKTLVVWMGEFGRTPRVNPRIGRDHYPRVFNVAMAGGGIKGGMQFGETCPFGYNVDRDPVHVRDFHATLLHLLGLDHQRLNVKFQGLDARLTGVEPARVVTEILA